MLLPTNMRQLSALVHFLSLSSARWSCRHRYHICKVYLPVTCEKNTEDLYTRCIDCLAMAKQQQIGKMFVSTYRCMPNSDFRLIRVNTNARWLEFEFLAGNFVAFTRNDNLENIERTCVCHVQLRYGRCPAVGKGIDGKKKVQWNAEERNEQ